MKLEELVKEKGFSKAIFYSPAKNDYQTYWKGLKLELEDDAILVCYEIMREYKSQYHGTYITSSTDIYTNSKYYQCKTYKKGEGFFGSHCEETGLLDDTAKSLGMDKAFHEFYECDSSD